MKNRVIAMSDFQKLDIRVGTIIEVRAFSSDLQVFVNFGGDIGVLKSCTKMASNCSREELIGKKVMAITNLEDDITGSKSECMILGAANKHDEAPVFIQPEGAIKNGLKVC